MNIDTLAGCCRKFGWLGLLVFFTARGSPEHVHGISGAQVLKFATFEEVAAEVDRLDIDTKSVDRLALLGNASGIASMKIKSLARMRFEVSELLKNPTRKKLQSAQILVSFLDAHGESVSVLKTQIYAATRGLPKGNPKTGPWNMPRVIDTRMLDAAKAPRALADFASVRYIGAALGADYELRRAEWKRKGTVAAAASTLAALPDTAVRERLAVVLALAELSRSNDALAVINKEVTRTRGFASTEEQLGFVLTAGHVWGRVEPAKATVKPAQNFALDLAKKFDWAVRESRDYKSVSSGCEGTARCHWHMPLYDQKDSSFGPPWLPNGPGKSQLCGPTTAAMALAANLFASPPESTSNWIDAFEGEGMVDRTVRMALHLGTDPVDGTARDESVARFIPLRWQMTYGGQAAPSFNVSPTFDATASTPPSFFRQKLQTTPGIVVHFGRYYRKTTVIDTDFLQSVIIEYERRGGHIIAVRGHDGDLFELNDPWGADHRWDTLAERHAHNVSHRENGVIYHAAEFLPNDSDIRHYFQTAEKDGDFPFIDVAGGIENANY